MGALTARLLAEDKARLEARAQWKRMAFVSGTGSPTEGEPIRKAAQPPPAWHAPWVQPQRRSKKWLRKHDQARAAEARTQEWEDEAISKALGRTAPQQPAGFGRAEFMQSLRQSGSQLARDLDMR